MNTHSDYQESADPKIGAIVDAFYPGVLGASVIAEVITGKTNPGGKVGKGRLKAK